MPQTILVVDDDTANRVTLERILVREGFVVEHAASGRNAMEQLRVHEVDLVLTDLKMPGMSGVELLRAARTLDPTIEVVLMTAYGTVEIAVEAMKEGAYDFVEKPFKRLEILTVMKKALEKRSLILENQQLRKQLTSNQQDEMLGRGPAMRALLNEAEQVAVSSATLLLCGESGTGKGRLARHIHGTSPRKDKPFVTVNCASLPETLLESELFGYEKGAFTGATQRKEGRFGLASGGTLFLDEITEMLPSVQVKLLRVLQDGEYERVGGTETLQSDLRIIAATNRDIDADVADGRFRKDLFYRLNVIRLTVPTLAERQEDIAVLSQHFLAQFSKQNSKDIRGFTPEAIDALGDYGWPGNVRELENAIERAVVLCREEWIDLQHLPEGLLGDAERPTQLHFKVGMPFKTMERKIIEETLRHCGGDKSLAASLLGITTRTIYRRQAQWAEEDEA